MIPILNLTRQYETLKASINQALVNVAASGQYILGSEGLAFEQEMAHYLGVKHVIGCANGTDALYLALKALNIGVGDEVITTPFSYMATSESIVRAGATPVFVDITDDTFNMDVRLVERAITAKTKAILPVHIFGQPADMTALSQLANKHSLAIIEDAAQAIGASYTGSGSPQNPGQGNDQEVAQKAGTLGDIGCFSFFPTKNLGAMGDAGMCTTNNDELAERLRMLRVHGSRKRYYHDEQGLNSRLDEIQAAVLRVKLPYIDQWNEARRQLAKRYNNAFSGLKDALKLPILEQDGMQQVFHQYTVQLLGANPVAQRETIQAALLKKGVQTMVYYPVPLYRQKTHANLQIVPEIFPVCERVCSRVLSLPIYPELTPEEQDQVCAALVQVFQSRLSALSL